MWITAAVLVGGLTGFGLGSGGQKVTPTPSRSDVAASAFEKAHPGVMYIGGKIKAPVRIAGDQPDFPEELRRTRRIGEVMILLSVIDEHGSLTDTAFLNDTQPDLQPYVLKALKTWRYKPATLGGQPVRVFLTTTVNICVR
jgi:outer membrane biosynthesis protein TonB